MSEAPVFVAGFRSGTTLLANLLGLHPDVAPWFETKCLCEALRWMRVLRVPQLRAHEERSCFPSTPAGFDLDAVAARMLWQMRHTAARIAGSIDSGKGAHERYPLGNDDVRYPLALAERALARWRSALGAAPDYARAARVTGGWIRMLAEAQLQAWARPRWINKTPEIARFAPELRDSLGSCRIVYMVRNGLDVVASARRLGWGEVAYLALNWKRMLTETRSAMREHPRDYLELRYEDLLAQPEHTLARLFEFCGLRPAGREVVQRYLAFTGGAFATPSRTRDALPGAEQHEFDRIAGVLQAELGYA